MCTFTKRFEQLTQILFNIMAGLLSSKSLKLTQHGVVTNGIYNSIKRTAKTIRKDSFSSCSLSSPVHRIANKICHLLAKYLKAEIFVLL